MDCQVRISTREDATAISQIVVTALGESNARDYLPKVIDQVEQSFSPDAILRLLTQRQVYVAILDHCVITTASLDHDVVRSKASTPHWTFKSSAMNSMVLNARSSWNGV